MWSSLFAFRTYHGRTRELGLTSSFRGQMISSYEASNFQMRSLFHRLPGSANKNAEYPVKFEFTLNDKCIFGYVSNIV